MPVALKVTPLTEESAVAVAEAMVDVATSVAVDAAEGVFNACGMDTPVVVAILLEKGEPDWHQEATPSGISCAAVEAACWGADMEKGIGDMVTLDRGDV